jgi:hypothetical protein
MFVKLLITIVTDSLNLLLVVVPADSNVSLVGQRHGGEDGAAEGDIVERVDDEGEGVHEDLARPLECPVKKFLFCCKNVYFCYGQGYF